MEVGKFVAQVQYNDMLGSSAADRSDRAPPEDFLRVRGLMSHKEYLLGIELGVGENHGEHRDPVFVRFLIVPIEDHQTVEDMLNSTSGPIDVRRVHQEMPISEFLSLFKRLSINLSPYGLLYGREIRYSD